MISHRLLVNFALLLVSFTFLLVNLRYLLVNWCRTQNNAPFTLNFTLLLVSYSIHAKKGPN
ncbi:hypothetical protein AAEY33_21085 [Peribacillus simplex]|uniref:hypothetical protein n=1 Tax=Peribacillus simplex TaxID=1478 RepID=UPI003267CCB1